MIKIYKNKKDIPVGMEYIQLNDIYFNEVTCDLIDDKAADIIREIDASELVGKYKVRSRFGDDVLNIDKISTGCKTVLNVLYNPDKVFWIMDCGDNALQVLYRLESGNVYCETPMIPFEMVPAEAVTLRESKVIDDYEDWYLQITIEQGYFMRQKDLCQLVKLSHTMAQWKFGMEKIWDERNHMS